MNKDVIYIEPEDDITDIITKIEKSKEKIIALVPPKKAGVFRSVVNIKLINKAGKSAEKTIVLVTTDPSIVKLAASTKLPVTKDLKTAPVIPEETEDENETISKEDLVEDNDEDTEDDDKSEEEDESDKEKEEDSEEKDDDSDKKEEKESDDEEEEEDKPIKQKEKNSKKAKKISSNFILAWIQEHKKLAIGGGVGLIAVILLLIWAFVIAPSVTVTVGIRTTSNNFSENITFTDKVNEENASEGKFYLEEKKIEAIEEVEFEATGKKNVGEKAKGSVVVYGYFKVNVPGSTAISAGSKFTISNRSFLANEAVSLSYSGNGYEECDNKDNPSQLLNSGCQVSARVSVTAEAPGSAYNIAASNSGWDTTASVGVYSDKAMEGGTDQEITVVQQSDIDKAKEQLAGANLEENKAKLLEQVGEGTMLIESSLKQETGDAVSTPAVGEEVKEGTKPSIKATTTTTIFVLDKTKAEEFITEKANLNDDQKIYEMKDPNIWENYSKIY